MLLLAACQPEIHQNTPADSAPTGFALDELSPDFGPAAGGTTVSVRGEGFTSATDVRIGETPCDSLTFLSDNELICVTPPGGVGSADVRVTEGAGTGTATFTYVEDVTDTGEDTGADVVAIDACTLGTAAVEVPEREPSDPIAVRVLVESRTPGEGAGIGLEGQLGLGPSGTDPAAWSWEGTLTWLAEAGDSEDWSGRFYPDDVGSFSFSGRFRLDHGDWVTCELETGGYGTLTVTPPIVEEAVDYCHIQWPCSMEATTTEATPDVYGWIYHGGKTMGAGQGAGVLLELGIGNDATDPDTDASWAWTPMLYNADKDGLIEGDLANDEYFASAIAPDPGIYDYVIRASADYGLSWTLCDLGGDSCNFGGSDNGYSSENAGSLVVY